MVKWVPLFSQTGSEIADIIKYTGIKPLKVLSNNANTHHHHDYIKDMVHTTDHNTLMNIVRTLDDDVMITLHGYLRIIPADICDRFRIYNGHPAPIHVYPELKGFNKQEDQFTRKREYDVIGCVVHRVTSELDAGKIVVSVDRPNTLRSVEDAYKQLKILSLLSWQLFFNKV